MLFALQKINANSEILPNITLGATIYDTCRSQTIGADRAKDIIKYTLGDHKIPIVGVIGPFESDVSIAVANLLRVFEIPQISYGSSSAELSNKELYGNFFRTVPPDSFQVQALTDIILHYGWNYIYTINSYGNYGEKGMQLFTKTTQEAGICVAKSESLPSLPNENTYRRALEDIIKHKEGKAHVIVVFTTQTDSAGLLKAAKETGAQNFTWLGSSGWSNRVDVTEGNEEVADGSLTVGHHEGTVNGFLDFLTGLDRTFAANHSSNTWFDEVLESVLKCTIANDMPQSGSQRVCSEDASLPRQLELAPVRVVVNAVYAMAYALNDMQKHYCPGRSGICDLMNRKLKRNYFIGYLKNVTFPDSAFNLSVKFNENQEIDGDYSIINFQQGKQRNGKYVVVGSWTSFPNASTRKRGKLKIDETLLSWGNSRKMPPLSKCSDACGSNQIRKYKKSGFPCCWACKNCKANAIIKNNTCFKCSLGYTADTNLSTCLRLDLSYPKWTDPISATLAFFGGVWILVALGTLTFCVIKRHHSVIKAASRELSLLIFIGIILCFVSSFISLAKPTDLVCTLRRYFGSTCFTFCYAPLVIKTNRIYRIFTRAQHSAARPPLVRPMSQVLISMGLVSLQLIITTAWTLSDAPKAIVEYPSLGEAVLVCPVSLASVAVNMSYNLLLMLMCTIFAFKTRRFPRNFNEAKHIGITMYITCSIWIIFLPTYFNTTTTTWRDFTFCLLYITIGCVNLLGLLLPKVVIVVSAKVCKDTPIVLTESCGEGDQHVMDSARQSNAVRLEFVAPISRINEESPVVKSKSLFQGRISPQT